MCGEIEHANEKGLGNGKKIKLKAQFINYKTILFCKSSYSRFTTLWKIIY